MTDVNYLKTAVDRLKEDLQKREAKGRKLSMRMRALVAYLASQTDLFDVAADLSGKKAGAEREKGAKHLGSSMRVRPQ